MNSPALPTGQTTDEPSAEQPGDYPATGPAWRRAVVRLANWRRARTAARVCAGISGLIVAVAAAGYLTGHWWINIYTVVTAAASMVCGLLLRDRAQAPYDTSDTSDDQRRWAGAHTLIELGEVTAEWITGGIHYNPAYGGGPDPAEGYDGGPDPETREIAFPLAQANCAGFVTDQSQPHYDGPGFDGAHWRQRAAVSGFADDAMRARLHSMAAGTGLQVIEHRGAPFRAKRTGVPVTTRAGATYTTFGVTLPRGYVRSSYDGVSAAGLQALCNAWQITIVDPDWDRPNLLWETLLSEFDEEPTPQFLADAALRAELDDLQAYVQEELGAGITGQHAYTVLEQISATLQRLTGQLSA
jgi:hypothetical protein